MKISKEQKRLKSIKEKLVIFPRKCSCCEETYIFAKMFSVDRYGVNKTVHRWNFCKQCTPEKTDVLKQIDTDVCYFGIAFVDDFYTFRKKKIQ